MPTKRRRRQLRLADACADVEREGHELPQSGSNVGEGSVPGELDFFDYLHSFTAKQWGDRIIYIYRQDPPDHNPGSGHYIEKVPHAIDKEYIKARHGGGRYLVFVKTSARNVASAAKLSLSKVQTPGLAMMKTRSRT
jgi:hypothetical protein